MKTLLSARGPRTRGRRGIFLALFTAIVALLLSGCMKMHSDIILNADDTMTITVDMGVAKTFAGMAGDDGQPLTAEDICADSDIAGEANSQARPYDDGEFIGCEVSGTMSLSDYDASGVFITREGNTYVLNMIGEDPTGGELEGMGPEELDMMGASFRFSITFPGEVISHEGGTVSGNTVVWEGMEFMTSGFAATGSAVPNGLGGIGGGGTIPENPDPGTAPEPGTEETPSTEVPGVPAPELPEPGLPQPAGDDGGMPAWLWALIGAAAVGIVALILKARRKPSAGAPVNGAPVAGAVPPANQPGASPYATPVQQQAPAGYAPPPAAPVATPPAPAAPAAAPAPAAPVEPQQPPAPPQAPQQQQPPAPPVPPSPPAS